jgi:hypothetical protein
MGDPLSDPRAQRLLAADPGEVGALAGAFRSVSSQAEQSAAALRGAHDANWTGVSADAFRTQLGKLPGDLDRVQQSYGDAASALDGYQTQLGPIKSQFESLAGQLNGAQSSLSTAQGNLATAQGNLKTADAAPHATSSTPAVTDAHTALQSASGVVGRAQDELSGLQSRAYHLLDEFDTVRGHARSAVSSAAGLAPQDNSSWFSSALHSIGNFMSGVGHFFVKFAKNVVHAAASLPSDIWQVMQHPTDLKDWSKLGGDVGTVAAAVGLVAAVVLCPADALGLEGVVEVAEGADGIATAAGTASTVTKTGADAGLVAEGKGSMTDVGFDLAGFAAGKVDLPGTAGAETDVEHLAGKSSALESYGLARAEGATHSQALANLSDQQRSLITHSAARLSSPARINYMRSSTTSALAAATTVKARLGLVNELGHTGLDQGLDALKEKVAPGSETPAGCVPAAA